MRGRRSPLHITLTAAERTTLERLSRSTTAPFAAVQRAQIVLKFCDGETISAIGRSLDLERLVVRKWLKRFARQRLDGLHDLPRSGRPPAFSPGGGIARRQDRVRAP